MRPATAIAWDFQRRHRWGLLALVAYVGVLVAIKLAVIVHGGAADHSSRARFALTVVVPITSAFVYFLAVFSYGLSGDLAARRSIFPARMFTLPISNAALAGWTMFWGSAAMMLLWVGCRVLVVWPADMSVPIIWPALLMVSLLAWTQALTWMSYGFAGARVIVTVLWLATIDTVVLLALHFDAREPVMLALLAPQPLLAYLVARMAVARARRGDIPDWSFGLTRGRSAAEPRREFASAARAQAWLEWREHGRTLPMLVAILLPCELVLLIQAHNAQALFVAVVAIVLATPPVMAMFVGAALGRARANEARGLSPFLATRPMTDVALIRARLAMAVRSTALTWTLVAIALPIGLSLTSTWPDARLRWDRTVAVMGAARAAVLVLMIVAVCIASTWRQLVQSLCVNLTGRAWLARGSVALALAIIVALGPVADWLVSPRGFAVTWDALPLMLGGVAVVRIALAFTIAARLQSSRLLSDRALVSFATWWCVAVFAVFAVLRWWMPSEFVPAYVLLLIAVAAVPLVRVSAAPLALAWNRHR